MPESGSSRFRALLSAVMDPLKNPYSPLMMYGNRKVEAYYRRVLTDKALAQRWRSYYLGNIDFGEEPILLDHGCGRGRGLALARLAGFRTFGQDVSPNRWWQNLSDTLFQIIAPGNMRLPWPDNFAHVVCDTMVIGHFPPDAFGFLAREVARVLKPGGIWLIHEANANGIGMHVTRRHYGRLYDADTVSSIAAAIGLSETYRDYEGSNHPLFPRASNYIRKILMEREFDYFEYGRCADVSLPKNRRSMWTLRLQKLA